MIKWIAWPALAVAGACAVPSPPSSYCSSSGSGVPAGHGGSVGTLAGAASMLGFVVATRLTTAANAIFLVYTAPLYVALLSPWVLHEPIRRGDWLTASARHARAGLFLC